MSRSPQERLNDVLASIERAIQADAQLTEAVETGDELRNGIAFDAILHNLFVIGEAIKSLPAELLESEPDINWGNIIGMRDVIGHHYHRIVPEIVHATIESDLKPLHAAIARMDRQLSQ